MQIQFSQSLVHIYILITSTTMVSASKRLLIPSPAHLYLHWTMCLMWKMKGQSLFEVEDKRSSLLNLHDIICVCYAYSWLPTNARGTLNLCSPSASPQDTEEVQRTERCKVIPFCEEQGQWLLALLCLTAMDSLRGMVQEINKLSVICLCSVDIFDQE